MSRIKFSTKRNQIKLKKKSKFWKFNLENDVIRDAHKVICNRNLRKIRRYWAFAAISAHSAILALELFELKIVGFFVDFGKFGDISPPLHNENLNVIPIVSN